MTREDYLKNLLGQLTLEEKISLLSGVDGWQTQDIPRLGIGSLKTTDGPAAARGALSVDGPSAAFLPAPVSQAATWSKEHMHAIGQSLCREVKTKAAQVLLAPTICCARNPLGGRNFESYSEDPHLSGALAIEYVRGVQETGEVVATVKHFVANEQEYERFTINAEISERALREIYLRPFETVIKSTNPPKCVMSAYNLVNGAHMDANPIIQVILRGEWDFKGLVMSDWGGTNSTTQSLVAGCDLEMPGPPEKRGTHLLTAVKEQSSEGVLNAIDASSLRVLELLDELHLLNLSAEEVERTRRGIETSSDNKADQKFLREVTADGLVLLKNTNRVLPLRPSELAGKKIAFIGPNALNGTPGGGGSAAMVPPYQTQPIEAFKSVLSDMGIEADIRYSSGAFIHKWLPLTSPVQWSAKIEGQTKSQAMLRTDFFANNDFSGPIIETQYRDSSYFDLFDSAPKFWYDDKNLHSMRISSRVTPTTTGKHSFGISSVGNARLFVNGHLLIDNFDWKETGETFYSFGSVEIEATYEMQEGRSYEVVVEAASRKIPSDVRSDDPIHVFGVQPSVRLGFLEQLPADPIGDAVKLSNESDVTIVVLGLNGEWESEGYDRQSMALPGGQDDLMKNLLLHSKSPESIIVVNQSGSPVEMDWADDIGTVVQAWYGGQEAGNALADVLLGNVNPSGKLPISWPRKYEDLSFEAKTWPGVEGVVKYEEELAVGYRYYQQAQIQPRWWLGHGLSYTSFDTSEVTVVSNDLGWDVKVLVKNTGSFPGREVMQCYVSQSADSKSFRELKGFGKTSLLKPGDSEEMQIQITQRDIAHWNVGTKKWCLNAGVYDLDIGRNVGDENMVRRQLSLEEPATWLPSK